MPRFLDCIQGSDEWHTYRAGHATASRFGDILTGKAMREAYMWELVGERLTGGPIRDAGGKAKEWGHEAEDLARRLYCERTGELVQQVGLALHSRIKWVGASSDGLLLPNRKRGIEVKSPFNSGIHARTLALGMPEVHEPQTQGNIWVLELDDLDYLSFDPAFPKPHDLYVQHIQRNDKFIKHLEGEVKAFLAEVAVATADIKNSNYDRTFA